MGSSMGPDFCGSFPLKLRLNEMDFLNGFVKGMSWISSRFLNGNVKGSSSLRFRIGSNQGCLNTHTFSILLKSSI